MWDGVNSSLVFCKGFVNALQVFLREVHIQGKVLCWAISTTFSTTKRYGFLSSSESVEKRT